ncbi:MAG TPA: CARDB domain-containing protein [Bacteroidales bacterium]|nr:CARDB domain-containing protein [Bacteroidales bacterium]
MKKVYLFIFLLFPACFLNAQVKVFHENFELSGNGADSVTASGAANNWSLNSRLFHTGARCDSNIVTVNDTAYLTTNQFSTTGYSHVILKFSHICKIELLDAGEIEISINNGAWVKLTGAEYINPGNSQFVNIGNKFTSNTYPLDWNPALNFIKPTQAWWKNEIFDLTAIAANSSNVRLRFVLRDANGNGANYNHGWYIDDIEVVAANNELVPPAIIMKTPIITDTVYNTGPFNIDAYITDDSGIDTAYVVFRVNNGPEQYVPMVWISDSSYRGIIPSYTYNNLINYSIRAIDNAPSHNLAEGISYWFYIKEITPVVEIGTGTAQQSWPYATLYQDARTQMIYTAAEITAADGIAGLITGIAFNVASASTIAMNGFTIQMQHTSLNTLTGFVNSGWTTVYSGTYTVTNIGWQTIPLQTPFNWNGTSNLLVNICYDNTTTSGNSPVYCTSAAGKTWTQYTNSSAGCSLAAGTVQTNRPNIRLTMPTVVITEDAGVTQIIAPTGTILSGVNNPVELRIKNFAQDTLKKVHIAWTLDGVSQTSFLWNGLLAEQVSSNVITIGNVNVIPGSHSIKAWTELPNDSTDEIPANDTLSGSFYACSSLLNGPYTIGSGGDFPTFTSALNSLLNCGVSGPVIFNVLSGTYNEQMNIPEITGVNSTNTVTFQSATGNYSDVILQYSATGTANNYVINLNGTDFFTFKNMTIRALGTSYGNVITYSNNSTYNTFYHNRLSGVNTANANIVMSVVYSPSGSSVLDSVMTFDGNIIENGSYGMYIYGQGSLANQLENKTVIKNNSFINQYSTCLNMYYQNAPEIISNTFTSNSSYATLTYSIYAAYCDNQLKILKNKITRYNSGYGIYIYYCDGAFGKEALIANNMVSVSGNNTSYGIYPIYCSYQKIYYNSVNVYSDAPTARAFNLSGTTSSLYHYIKNNIFAYMGTSTGGVAIYIGYPASITAMDYNDLYSTGTNLGYWNGLKTDLAAWRTASSKDSNSVSVDPSFISNTDLHTFSSSINGKAVHLNEVTDDIDNHLRNATTPDIGASEFDVPAANIGILDFTAPVNSCGAVSPSNVTVRLKNAGSAPLTTADVYYCLNNGPAVHEVMSHTIQPDSVYLYTFTQQANLTSPGIYTFKAWVHMTGDTLQLNDTISNYSVYSGYDFNLGAYTMSFEATENFSDWSTMDVNGDNAGWTMAYSDAANAHTGVKSSRLYTGVVNTGNDWLFTRCFTLNAGSTYKIEFWYKVSNASYPQIIDLKAGMSATPAAMTSSLTTLNNLNNTTYQKATVFFIPVSSGSYYFGWWGHSAPSSYYAFIDDINISLLPPQEAALVSIVNPVSACGLTSSESVDILIQNTGAATINGNLTAYYTFKNGPVVSQAVTGTIAPNDTLAFSFSQTADAHVVSQDSVFPLKVWISLVNDPFHYNDTLTKDIASSHVPASPVTINDTTVFGGTATMHAISGDMIYWYDVPSGGTYLCTGAYYTTPALYVNTVYYAQALSAGGTTTWTFDNTLQGWTVQNPCSSAYNWSWASDAGAGALFASDPGVNAYQLVTSPSVMISGAANISISFRHRYGTESCCDEGYMAYRLDNGAWTTFVPGINTYTNSQNIDYDPLNSCVSNTKSCYAGTQSAYITSSGNISNGGASTIQLAFVFTSDGSVASTGWFIDEVTVSGGMGGCASPRIPDTAFVQLNPYDASAISIVSPVDGCVGGSENISIKIRNNGLNTINGNLTAAYTINGGSPQTQPVTNTILPGDTTTFTFTAPFMTGLSQSNQDSVYNITAYVVLAGDSFLQNDTTTESLTLLYTPAVPVVNNVTVPYATQATLHAVSADSIRWYDVATGGTPLANTSTYVTPLIYNNTVYYAEAYATGGTSYWTFNSGLEGWTSTASCGFSTTWVWASDGGTGAAFAQDVGTTSSQVLKSPVINLSGASTVTLKYRHRYTTESCCDHGYVMYKLNNNQWTPLTLTTGSYTGSYSISYEPMAHSCSSGTYYSYSNTAPYQSHAGTINTAGADSMRIAFVFYTDGSVASDGWYIDSVVVKGSGSGCASARMPDTVFVTGVPACDMSVVNIYAPNSAIDLTDDEVITVKVKNYGTAPASNIPVHYSINGGAVVTEVIPGPVASNDTALFTFATHADLSAYGTYNISVYTTLSCDLTHINDTLHKDVVCSPIPYCASNSLYLYENIGNVTFGTLNNGNPLPVLGNTTVTHNYTDYTSLPATPVTVGSNYQFSVSQIESGNTFYPTGVKAYIDYNRNGVFDTPAEMAFSGVTISSTSPTVSGTISIPVTGVVTGMNTRMRIVMDRAGTANPCGTYSYGETEDYFLFISPQIPHDAGVIGIIQPSAVESEAAVIPVKVIVRNFGTDTIRNTSNMVVAFTHNGQAPQTAIWNGGDIPPLQSDTATLPNLIVMPNLNTLCAYTQLAGDSNTFNDTYCKTFAGTPLHDAGIVAILEPGSQSVSGSLSPVRVVMKNFGAGAITSINLCYKLNGVLQATQPWTGSLLPNSYDTITFTQTYAVPSAGFTICAYTSFPADSNHINDTLYQNSYGVFTSALPYYDNFDDGIVNWMAVSSAGSVWELGQPSYGTTNSAFSPWSSWDINLSEPYGNSANSMLYTQNFDFSNAVDMRMKFWFNLNSQNGADGFRIEYTTDTGSTWNVLGIVSDPNGSNWYNTASLVSSSKPGWSGNTLVWRSCYYKLSVLNNIPVVRFRFVFSSDASTNGVGLSIDNFAIYKPTLKDVGVEAVSDPKVMAQAGSSVQLKVRLRNYGTSILQSVPIAYKINAAGPVITFNWSGVLLSNDSAMVTIATPFTVPAGEFTIYAYTQLTGDGDHLNDTCRARIMGVPKYFVPYSDSLEADNYWVSYGVPNLWEYGAPSSSPINVAHSPAHAWKTNIDGNYINNATSYLYSPWFYFTGVDSAYLEFWHWYHTQSGSDYGLIEYTVNNGTSWVILGSQADPQGVNWYNALVGGLPCWSGNSSGYVYSKYRLTSVPAIINATVPVRFRYKFNSNTSVCNYDGWAIDDFAITAPAIPKDAGISGIIHPASPVMTGSSVTVQVVIRNYGTDTLQKVPVRYFVNGGAVVAETWYGALQPGQTVNYTFTTPYTSPGTAYSFCAFTRRNGDIYWANDTLCTTITTSPAANDLGISKILTPGTVTTPGDPVTVSVRIQNYGTAPQSGISVVYFRNFVQTGAGTYAGTIAAGDSADYTFATTFISPSGNYNICAKTILTGDADPLNDQICIYPIGTGIEDYDYTHFELLQNIPNPAMDRTLILFYVPTTGSAGFELSDIFGQVLMRKEFDAVRGENRMDLDIRDVPSGVYFYSVEYSNKKLTRRMIVVR